MHEQKKNKKQQHTNESFICSLLHFLRLLFRLSHLRIFCVQTLHTMHLECIVIFIEMVMVFKNNLKKSLCSMSTEISSKDRFSDFKESNPVYKLKQFEQKLQSLSNFIITVDV